MSVYRKISDDVIEFDSCDDFLAYYKKNPVTIDEMKTRGLNMKYKIPNYKIGRKNDKIILLPINKTESESHHDENKTNNEEKILELEERISTLEQIIKQILQQNRNPNQTQSQPPMQNKNKTNLYNAYLSYNDRFSTNVVNN